MAPFAANTFAEAGDERVGVADAPADVPAAEHASLTVGWKETRGGWEGDVVSGDMAGGK